VLTEATIENLKDVWDVQRNLLPLDKIRRITVNDALVDTGATMLALPKRFIRQLGLTPMDTRRIISSVGAGEATIYEAVRLTIQGRFCMLDVMEVPDDVPVLIGQLPLERLDFVVDPGSCSLIGNPAHGGQHVLEVYIESISLSTNPQFLALIERSRQRRASQGGMSSQEMRRRFELGQITDVEQDQ
jgi:predicted aspartyl protease